MDYVSDEEDLVNGYVVQLPQEEWFNDVGPASSILVQFDFVDLPEADELADAEVIDDDLQAGVDAINDEMQATEEEVPFSWQYWLHDENTLPVPDESGAPPLPSGWVDPITEEEIP